MEVTVADPDLAHETADLLSIANKSRSRSLNELVGLATRQVRACSGAAAALWQGREPMVMAASHPDVCELAEVELAAQRGPAVDSLAAATTLACPDTLYERRWPEYAHAALCRGVRCSVTLVHRSGGAAVTLSLFSARPRVLDPEQLPVAELLVAVGGAVIGNMSSYGDARRTALQLREGAQARALVDQAKGVLMHAFGCSADEAFERMRKLSQQRNLKMTEVAQRVIDSRLASAR
jgi:ANTAR domain-containing protein